MRKITQPSKKNHATSPKCYRSYYPHWSRYSVSPVCGISVNCFICRLYMSEKMFTKQYITHFGGDSITPLKIRRTKDHRNSGVAIYFYFFLITLVWCYPGLVWHFYWVIWFDLTCSDYIFYFKYFTFLFYGLTFLQISQICPISLVLKHSQYKNSLKPINVSKVSSTRSTHFSKHKKKSRKRETKHHSTDADSSTNTTIRWTKNTQTPIFFFKRKKIIQNAKTQKQLEICQY